MYNNNNNVYIIYIIIITILLYGVDVINATKVKASAKLSGASRLSPASGWYHSGYVPVPHIPDILQTRPEPKNHYFPVQSKPGVGYDWVHPPHGPLSAGLIPNRYPESMILKNPKQYPQFGQYQVSKGPGMVRNPELPAGYNFDTTSGPARDQRPKFAIKRSILEHNAKMLQRMEDFKQLPLDHAAKDLLDIGNAIHYTNMAKSTRGKVSAFLAALAAPQKALQTARVALLKQVAPTEKALRKLLDAVKN